MSDRQFGRRRFLENSAGGLILGAAWSATARGQSSTAPAVYERVSLGLIGCGDFGRRQHLGRLLLPNPRVDVVAVCDVDQAHREYAARDIHSATGNRPSVYHDFRELLEQKDIDAVVIVVPDHWHAIIAIAAMEAGKDVYCEKPLTLTIAEGQAMVAAARRYGSVFQTGSQQRSDRHYFMRAYELVKNGAIGKLTKVTTHLGAFSSGEWQRPQTPSATLDWNFWLGPAPYADYSPNRCHYLFRGYSDYSGGKMTDHGAHQNDIAQWLIGADGSGPTRVEGAGTFSDRGPHDVPLTFTVTYTYGNHGGVQLVCTSDNSKLGGSVEIDGANGHITVGRNGIKASDPSIVQAEAVDYDNRHHESYVRHYDNWIDCIASRERPRGEVEIGHRSATVCHLGNLAIRLQRPLDWDPVHETFVNDLAADRLLSRPMRAPWRLC